MGTHVKSEPQALPLNSNNKVRIQVRALKRTKERQDSRLEDLVKFETLCCRGDDHACERLGGKRHRSSSKCWIYPKICYHCNLIDSDSKLVGVASPSTASTQPIKIRGWSHLTTANGRLEQTNSLNERPVQFNKMMSAQISPSLESTLRFRALASFMSAWHAKQEDCAQDGTGPTVKCVPDAQVKSGPDALMPSIEGDDQHRLPTRAEQDSKREDRSADERFRRSQAPSPEIPETSSVGQGEQLPDIERVGTVVEVADEVVRRDPRCEVRFMLN